MKRMMNGVMAASMKNESLQVDSSKNPIKVPYFSLISCRCWAGPGDVLKF